MKGYKFLADFAYNCKIYGRGNKRIVVEFGKIIARYEVKKGGEIG